MKKMERHRAKLRLVLQREIVLHLDCEQLAQVAGGSKMTPCLGCVTLQTQSVDTDTLL
ncbi:MAG TPA: hypothetical protein VFP84_09895 [Kofleriaceae bacterium]|nr:hypothetical protein [Kofleriaceae bacterium]